MMNFWASSVELFNLTEQFISGDGTVPPALMQNKWTESKNSLLCPMRVPPRSSASEQRVKDSVKTPLNFGDDNPPTLLDQNFIDECLLLSALFEFDELEAAKLLRLAEHLQSDWPEWPRGLVAVMLFYDARLRRASTLKIMLREALTVKQSQCGRFFNQLVQDGLICCLLDAMRSLNEDYEFERLESVQALGPVEHRREVLTSFRQFLRTLNDVVLGWATENSLSSSELNVLLPALASYDPPKFESPRGAPDSVLGLLSALTATCLSRSSMDNQFFSSVRSSVESVDWQCLPMKAFIKLVIAISYGARDVKHGFAQEDQQLSHFFYDAFRGGALHFFLKFVVPSPWLKTSGDLCDVFSYLFTSFLSTQHQVLRSLVLGGNDDGSDEGFSVSYRDDFHDINQLLSPTIHQPRNEPDTISTLMECIAGFYHVAVEVVPDCTASYWSSFNRTVVVNNAKDRNLYLSLFISFAGDILPADKYAKYVNMLTALISSEESTSSGAFHFLVDNGAASSDRRRVSLQHFQYTFQNVAALLQQLHSSGNMSGNTASSFDEAELEALCCTVRLLTRVAKYSIPCRTELYPIFISSTFSLITSSIPSLLKVELFDFAASLIGSIQHSIQLWDIVDQSQLLPAADATGQFSGGMWTELCNIETRLCSFPVTSSFLDLLASLLVYNVPIVLTERGIFEPVVSFVVDAVLPRLTNTSTTPSSAAELWRVAAPSYLILTRLLDHLVVLLSPSADPTSLWAGNLLIRHPGFLVYRALLRAGSSLFKNSIKLLKLAHAAIYQDAELPDYSDHITSTANRILDLFKICLENADLFDKRLLTLPSFGADCHLSVSQMLTAVDSAPAGSSVGVLGNVIAILNFVGNSDSCLLHHCLLALKIMSALLTKSECHAAIYNLLTLDVPLQIRSIGRFVNCVEGNVGAADTEAKQAVVKQIQIRSMETVGNILLRMPAPNVAYILLGLFYRRPVVTSTLIELETGQQIKTCFKSIIAHLGSTQDVEVSYEGFRVLQRLCSNEKTALPVLNLLRSSPPFLLSQVVEGSLVEALLVTQEITSKHYLAVASLFHCLTVDLHMCSTSQLDLKSYVLKAAQILLQATSTFGTNAPLLLSVVQRLSFQHETVDLTPLERFSSFVQRPISNLIRLLGSVNVETDNAEGVRLSLFDIHRLHSALTAIKGEFLASSQASTQTSPELVSQVDELVEGVVRYAAECNAKTELLHARVCFFEKWRDLVQSVITVVRSDVEATASICFDIATVLLEKIQLPDSSDLFFPNACSLISAVSEIIAVSSCAFDVTSPMSHLLKSVVSCIVFSRKANLGLESRVHLYGFILKFVDVNLKVIRHLFENADENLLQVVLFDCSSNSAHTRLACLSYCLLQRFVRLDTSSRVFDALKSSKHVPNICISMASASPTGEQYRLLEARLSFLSTLCLLSPETCLMVVNARPVDGLLTFGFDRIAAASNNPTAIANQPQHQPTLSPVESARLVTCFYSTMDFISSIFSTLPYNRLVAGEVSRFVIANSIIFSELLSKPANYNMEWLEVSSKAFAIVCRCLSVLKNVVGSSSSTVVLELGSETVAKLALVKDTVLQALVAYADIGDLVVALESARPVDQLSFMLPICRIQESLLMYASELINHSNVATQTAGPMAQLDTLVFSISSFSGGKDRMVSFRPDVSHLVRLLTNIALFAERASSDLKSVSTLLADLDSLSLKEVNEVIAAWHSAGASPCDGLTPLSECREIARSLLELAVQNLGRRVAVVLNNMNLALILLFRHYDVYLDIACNDSKSRTAGLTHEAVTRLVRAVIDSCPDSCVMQLHHAIGQLNVFANEARACGFMQVDDAELASSLLRRIRKLTSTAKQKLDTGHFGIADTRFR